MNKISYLIAEKLLEIEAIKINFKEPFVWVSGIKSPVYCDNRLSLSNSAVRTIIKESYAEITKEKFPNVELIAGVATGAIAQGALVADMLNLPFVYVREKPKEHGMKKVVEGRLLPSQKTVIIEDLISTGGSSIRAMKELRNEKADVLGMIAAFTYEFPESVGTFNDNNCKLFTLTTFSILKDVAVEKGYISKEDAIRLVDWRNAPHSFIWD